MLARSTGYGSHTTASACKSRKGFLTQMDSLKRSLNALKKDAAASVNLEWESQATFEHMAGQIASLQTAFTTLSEVMVEEVDAIRSGRLSNSLLTHKKTRPQ